MKTMKRKLFAALAATMMMVAIAAPTTVSARTEATGTYSDDGCGNRTCDGDACDCTTKIVIVKKDCE